MNSSPDGTGSGHRAFISSLSPDQKARLTNRSNGPGLFRLSCHFGLILALGFLILIEIPFWPFLMVPQGILLVFLFTLLHETIHRTAFRARPFNDGVAWFCGFLLILPAEWFRLFHFAHHRYTQDPEKDPELATPKPKTRTLFLWMVSGLPLWVSSLSQLIANARGLANAHYIPASMHRTIAREARILCILYALVLLASFAGGWDALLFTWLLPLLLGQPFLRLYLLAEHGGCPETSSDMFTNTNTILTTPVVRFFAWNMPYHVEHHAYPGIPFHKLPEFHTLIRGRISNLQPGYWTFVARYWRSLA